MDDSHHADRPTPTKPRRPSFNAHVPNFSTPHYQPPSMKQSQILTPPTTPPRSPRSPRSSMPTSSAHKPERSDRLTSRVHFDLHMSIHRSSSTHIDSSMSESSLWTLPGFDDGDVMETPPTATKTSKAENRWSRLLQNAASSNRDRHRARLEGDGWAFVGGRYSDELQELSDESAASAASVDEEFDVVVLPRESVGC